MSVDGDAGVVTAVVGSSAALAAFLTAKDVCLMLRWKVYDAGAVMLHEAKRRGQGQRRGRPHVDISE